MGQNDAVGRSISITMYTFRLREWKGRTLARDGGGEDSGDDSFGTFCSSLQ